jgi:glucose-6-phosphate dehydrogenase assembly protein OpcA
MDGHDGATSAGTLPGAGPRKVEVGAIEDALTQLWMSRGGGARATMRTYVLNLIVFAGARSDRAEIEAVAARVGALHPARIVILYTTPGTGSRLDAWVSAQVEYPGADERTGSEQITLEAAGESMRQLPGAIIPLLIPDIPAVLWWPGEEVFTHPLFLPLMDACDQLVIDTGTYPDPIAMLGLLHTMATEEYPGVAFRDIAWARLTPWRELTAQFFDASQTRPFLDGVERVTVTYAVGPSNEARPEQALLYASWLVSRLGWETIPNLRRLGRQALLVVRREDVPVTIEFSAQRADDLPAGSLLTTTLTAQHNESTATFAIQRADDREHAVVTMTMNEQTASERIVPMIEGTVADVLSDETMTVKRDHVFEDALVAAIRLAGPRSGGTR